MELIARLRGWALGAPHVFLVEARDGAVGRLGAERALGARRWPLAETPADADILLVCGDVTDATAPSVTRLSRAMAEPAASAVLGSAGPVSFDIAEAEEAERALDAAAALLRERACHPPRRAWPQPEEEEDEDAAHHEDEGDGHEHHQNGGEHEHHHNHHGDPGGLPMAGRAEDRDGLKLDVLEIPFDFGLRGWPTLVRVVLHLQGDVVQKVRAEPADGHGRGSWWDGPWRAALAGERIAIAQAERMRAGAHLDSLARLLEVAGHGDAAIGARRLRNRCLGRDDASSLRADLASLSRAIRRGGMIERATAGTGILTAERAQALGVSGPALRAAGCARDLRVGAPGYGEFEPVIATGEGDARARLLQWLAEVDSALALAAGSQAPLEPVDGRLEGPRGVLAGDARPASQGLLAAIAERVVGQELAAARLTIASLDPDGNDAGETAHRAPDDGSASDGA